MVSVDVPGWVERLTTGKFEISTNFVYLLGDPAMGVAQTYMSDNQLTGSIAANVDGYVNPKVDALLAEAGVSTSRDLRARLSGRVSPTRPPGDSNP